VGGIYWSGNVLGLHSRSCYYTAGIANGNVFVGRKPSYLVLQPAIKLSLIDFRPNNSDAQ